MAPSVFRSTVSGGRESGLPETDQPRHDFILSSPLNPDRMRWFYFPVPQLFDLQG